MLSGNKQVTNQAEGRSRARPRSAAGGRPSSPSNVSGSPSAGRGRVTGQHRSTQPCPLRRPRDDEVKLRRRVRQIALTPAGLADGASAAAARRLENQQEAQPAPMACAAPQTCRKRRRIGPQSVERLSATHPNHVWAIDFEFDETADYRRLKLANIVDEYTWRNDGSHGGNDDGRRTFVHSVPR